MAVRNSSPDALPPLIWRATFFPARRSRILKAARKQADPASVPTAHTNGATVRIGGGDDGISDDDVDVPPFMRH